MIKSLHILVEGPTDSAIVRNLLIAAELWTDSISIGVCRGKQELARKARLAEPTEDQKIVALADADQLSTYDSRLLAAQQLGNPNIPVYCAIPTIEAWLFADDRAAQNAARSEGAREILERISLPELIPYPKQLASYVFSSSVRLGKYAFLRGATIGTAAARSPSLRNFIEGITSELGVIRPISSKALGETVSRNAISTLLRELPGASVAWKTLDGTSISADELAREVQEGTEVGKQYSTEIMRVARDLVSRKSQKP